MDDHKELSLSWTKHQSTLINALATLLDAQTLVDCKIGAEGKFITAHKVVLSACSSYFAAQFQEHTEICPIVLLRGVKYQELRNLIDYMYRGEVTVTSVELEGLLKLGESLQFKGFVAGPNSEASEHGRGGPDTPEQSRKRLRPDSCGDEVSTSSYSPTADDLSDSSDSSFEQASTFRPQEMPTIIWRTARMAKNLRLQTNDVITDNVQPLSQGTQGLRRHSTIF
ncbi:longitudinals lacking protein, isoforms H/M/V-like [Drosophila subobscura]|uniref:longitudinals lacking protein, isoforms H/M/V-like n=1 Tax=Drosophila subobscura TaxID=7241 RepID=UPI00155A3630|nr:longitudinals lacking protein, isoforms H/M/V-like [Drosophila subobscura]